MGSGFKSRIRHLLRNVTSVVPNWAKSASKGHWVMSGDMFVVITGGGGVGGGGGGGGSVLLAFSG